MKQVDSLEWSADIGAKLKPYMSANKPVVIRKVSGCAPAGWSIRELESRYGDIKIRTLKGDSQFFSYDDKKERVIIQQTLREFLDRGIRNIGADGHYYALGKSPAEQFPGLMEELRLPDALEQFYSGAARFVQRNIWMSPKGTRTALHFDVQENFNLQIEGEKSFLLFPPINHDMYPYKLNSQASYVSAVDPRNVDREKFPDFPLDRAQEAVLQSGDVLYLPYCWWHQVNTTGAENLNANVWWIPRLKLLSFWRSSMRGAFVLAHRKGQHPHKRAEELDEAA
jgi:hypothetical protein